MARYDAVFVGSGINALASAALLSREGWSVCVLERDERVGGAIRTVSDFTLPGFTHEVLSSWHPLFQGSATYAELGEELGQRGLEYRNTELPTATAFPDGAAMFLHTALEANVAEFERHATGDGAAWETQFGAFMANADLGFGVLGAELWSAQGLRLGRTALKRLGKQGTLAFLGSTLASCRDWCGATFASERAHGLLAPWVLHTGLGPDQASSGFMTQVIACALQLGGMPVPVGGGIRLVETLTGMVTDAGGRGANERPGRADRRLGRPRDRGHAHRGRGRGGAARGRGGRHPNPALRSAARKRGPPPMRRRPPRATAMAGPECNFTSRLTRRRAGAALTRSGSAAPRSST